METVPARRVCLLLTAALATGACAQASPSAEPPRPATTHREAPELHRFFPNVELEDATFVLLDGETGALVRFNPARARQGLLPASTFKIVNAAIALETGVADGPDFVLPWDGRQTQAFWSPAWSRDHTLATAMRTSAIWYYQELARRIGPERMQRYLDLFAYGNRSMAGGIDQFWLTGGLRISPEEQVHLLRRLYAGELPLAPQTVAVLRQILLLEEAPGYRLSGKTGTVPVTDTREMAWLVGWVERDERVWFYALNVEGDQVWEQWGPPAARLTLVRDILRTLDVIPEG